MIYTFEHHIIGALYCKDNNQRGYLKDIGKRENQREERGKEVDSGERRK